MEYHLQQLSQHCRVCGKRLSKAKGRLISYNCGKHQEELKAIFNIDVSQDDIELHPSYFCQSCYCCMKRLAKAMTQESPMRSSIAIYEWTPHTEGCLVRTSMCIIPHLFTPAHRFVITLRCWQGGVAKIRRREKTGGDIPTHFMLSCNTSTLPLHHLSFVSMISQSTRLQQ